MMLDSSLVSSTRLQESNFVHNFMNNLVQYVNYTSIDLNLGRFSIFQRAFIISNCIQWTESYAHRTFILDGRKYLFK